MPVSALVRFISGVPRRTRRVTAMLLCAVACLVAGTAISATAGTTDGGALTPGVPVTATFGAIGDQVTYTATVPADQRLTLTVSPRAEAVMASVSSSNGYFDPSTVGNATGQAHFTELSVAPVDRTVQITLYGWGATGALTLTPALVTDATATATFGTPTTAQFTTPGQKVAYSLTGTAGHRVGVLVGAVHLSAASLPYPAPLRFDLVSPTGDLVTLGEVAPGVQYAYPVTAGSWTLVVDTLGEATGTADVTLVDVVDRTTALTLGQATKAALATPWTRRAFTFSGVRGRRLRLRVNSSRLTTTGASAPAVIGSVSSLGYDQPITVNASGTAEAVFDAPLPDAAQQTLTLRSDYLTTGTLTFTLSLLPADPVTPLALNTPTSVTVRAPYLNPVFLVRAQPGQHLVLKVTDANLVSRTGTVGAIVGVRQAAGISMDYNLVFLRNGATSGTADIPDSEVTSRLAVVVDPDDATTGSLTLEVTTAAA